jgi:hypothetical protein
MAAPKVVIGAEDRGAKGPVVTAAERATATWSTLWWIGLLLFVAGLIDLGLAFYPPNFGEPTWRFEVAASIAQGLPLPIVGLLSATMAALAGRTPGRVRVVLVLNALATAFLLVMLITFALVISSTFKVAAPGAEIGLYKAAFRAVLLYLVFAGATAASLAAVAKWLRGVSGDV